jgi:class 3 adenylate cyclase
MKLRQFFKIAFSGDTIIPWMLVVAILPMILVSFLAYNLAETILHRAININLTNSIQKKIEVIDNYISERKLDLYQISELPTLIDAINHSYKNGELDFLDTTTMTPFANYLNYMGAKIGMRNAYVLNLSGKVIYALHNDNTLGKTLTSTDPQLSDLYKAFNNAKILRAPYLLTAYKAGRMGGSELFLSSPVNEGGKLKAILVMKLASGQIDDVIDRLLGYGKTEETLLATLVNNKPVVVMHTEQLDEDDSSLPENITKNPKMNSLLLGAIRGEAGSPIEVDEGNKGVLAVYRYVPQLNMGMLIQYDRSEIFERIHWLRFNMLLFIGVSLFFVLGLVFWISRELWKAHAKNEQLLENILPPFVIEELKDKKKFPAKNVESVAIVFVDLVDFTTFASNKSPDTVVNILDKIFTIFDKLCDKYGLMKIKTIGDAYMAAAGLSFDRENQSQRAVDFGMEVISAVKHFNINYKTNFSVRIGIDTGMITEGIIGKSKFSYDIWGNAVNRASRMQSTGAKNKIQITIDTYNALSNRADYVFTLRTKLMVKGLGEMDTYFVEEKISPLDQESF